MEKISEQTLEFPLYHGTSSFFLSSIQKHGLGGINIVQEWRVLEFLESLRFFGDNHLKNVAGWKDERWLISEYIDQNETFQHGHIYLSPVLAMAQRYASRHFGSEIISDISDFLLFIKKAGHDVTRNFSQHFPQIFEIINTPHKPVILKIEKLPITFLHSGEYGEDAKEQLDKIRKWLSENPSRSIDSYTRRSNFKICEPIPFKLISIM